MRKWVNHIFRHYLRKRMSRIRRYMAKPHEMQRFLLKTMVLHAAGTEWGKAHHFSQIKSPKQFAKRVPVQDYESLKPFIQRSDGSAKGDWDVGITLDVIDAASRVDQVVLASGDGDFDLLLERVIQRHGTEAVVYGVPGLTALSLIRAATRYVPIEGALLLKH